MCPQVLRASVPRRCWSTLNALKKTCSGCCTWWATTPCGFGLTSRPANAATSSSGWLLMASGVSRVRRCPNWKSPCRQEPPTCCWPCSPALPLRAACWTSLPPTRQHVFTRLWMTCRPSTGWRHSRASEIKHSRFGSISMLACTARALPRARKRLP